MANAKGLDIAVDFDGTCVKSQPGRRDGSWDPNQPLVPMLGAKEALLSFRAAGHRLLLYSTRSNRAIREDPMLDPLVRAGKRKPNRVPFGEARYQQMLDYVAANLPDIFDAIDDGLQGKPRADVFIDDRALRFGGDDGYDWATLQTIYGATPEQTTLLSDVDGDEDVDDYDAALEWFLERVPISTSALGELSRRAKMKAFWVAGVAKARMAATVYNALVEAIQNGTDFGDFKGKVQQQLYDSWGGAQPARLETVFRTNVQGAYSAGRWFQSSEPAVKQARPYKQFSAVMDNRTSAICSSLNGVTLPADDPFWQTHNPPLHFSCRSTLITLTEDEALSQGLTADTSSYPSAQDGFGEAPSIEDWRPDLSDLPAEIAGQLPSA